MMEVYRGLQSHLWTDQMWWGQQDRGSLRVQQITLSLIFMESSHILNILLDMSNREGRWIFGETWKNMDQVDFQGYLGLLILTGAYKSREGDFYEPLCHWKDLTSSHVFWALRTVTQDQNAGNERNSVWNMRDTWVRSLPGLHNHRWVSGRLQRSLLLQTIYTNGLQPGVCDP